MAKSPAKEKAKSRIFIKAVKIPLDDLALDTSSGWRDVASDRVKELKDDIYGGNFGQTTLGKPSVLCDCNDQAGQHVFLQLHPPQLSPSRRLVPWRSGCVSPGRRLVP